MKRLAIAAMLVAAVVTASPSAGAPAQTPKRGGTVVVGAPAGFEPACFNPNVGACFLPSTFGIFGIREDLIFARPFSSRPDLSFRPDLVSRLKLAKKPSFTLTFHIRPEARWSDGRSVTASDLRYYWQSFVTSEFARGCCSDNWLFTVTRARALDAKTLRMWVRAPVGPRLVKGSFNTGIVPRHVFLPVDPSTVREDVIANPKTGDPIASGPFLMQGRRRGRDITLVRNSRYWGPHTAYVDRLVFRFLAPGELAAALRAGQVDLILPVPITDAAVQEIRRNPRSGIRVASSRGTLWENLSIRLGPDGHPALKDKLVRRALAHGIDRSRLVRMLEQRVFGSTTPRLAPLESVVHLAQSPHYVPNWKRYRRDPAQARRLLARAGCSLGADGIYVCGGEPLTLLVGTSAGVERRQRTLELVKAQLREVGVDIIPRYYRDTRLVDDAFTNGDLDLALWAFDYAASSTFTPGNIFRCGRTNNKAGYCSRLVNRELDNADRVLDDESRARALNRADRLLARDVPMIPLYQVPAYVAYRTRLHIPNLDPNDVLWNAQDWWLER